MKTIQSHLRTSKRYDFNDGIVAYLALAIVIDSLEDIVGYLLIDFDETMKTTNMLRFYEIIN